MRYRRVRGLELDGTSITMTIGRYQFDILKSSYGDSLNVEKLRQMGHQTIDAITPGIYETEDGKISLSESVFRGELMPLVQRYGWGNDPHAIIFSYTNPFTGSDSDQLLARIIGTTATGENTAKPLEKELKLVVSQIFWTDNRKTINRMGDVYTSPGLSML
jgi:hypothetical protein